MKNSTKLANVEVHYPGGMEYREPSGGIPSTRLDNHFEGAVVGAISPYLKYLQKNKTKYSDYQHPDYVVHVPYINHLKNITTYDKAIKELNNVVRKEVIKQAIVPHLINNSANIKELTEKPIKEDLTQDYSWISPQSKNVEDLLTDMLNYIHVKYSQNRQHYYPNEDDYLYDPYKQTGIGYEDKVPANVHYASFVKTLKPKKIASNPFLKELFDNVQKELS